MPKDKHEQLCSVVEKVFEQVLSSYVPNKTTAQQIEQKVADYVKTKFKIEQEEELYVKTLIGDISYIDVSDILDNLMFHNILEKCCKYDKTNQILLIVLIASEIKDQ